MPKVVARKKRARRKAAPDYPEVGPKKVVRVGSSHYIALPPTWFKAHHLDPGKVSELLTAADTDILILNPKSVAAFTRKISRLVRPGSLAATRKRKKRGV